MKRCRYSKCGKRFAPKFSTLEECCSTPCAIGYARESSPDRLERLHRRAAAKEKRDARAALREGRERLKTLGEHCADTQRVVNTFVRVRDFGKGCISCETGAVQDAGHLFPVGRKYMRSMFRFMVKVIHGQCRQCNRMEGGNVHGYLAGLVKRYGQAYVDECNELKRQADTGELPKLTREMCKQIAAEHRTLAREAKSGIAA